MITITRRVEFDAAHRVIGHKHKCRFLHGHRYILEVSVTSLELNELGMVVDFGDLKSILKKWVDDNIDHTVILSNKDAELGRQISEITGQKIYYIDSNPTAENIGYHLFHDVLPVLFKDLECSLKSLRLYETPNCYIKIKK